VLEGEDFAELLGGPFGGGVVGNVGVEDLAGADFHGYEDVEDFEVYCDAGYEITGDDHFGVVGYEGGPALVSAAFAWSARLHVFADGCW